MNFASLTFLLFLPIVFAAYWMLKNPRAQNICLIVASYFFYGWWDWRFCGLMLLSSLIDYWLGAKIGATNHQGIRRTYICLSLVSNLGLLAFFKYCNFFLESVQTTCNAVGWEIHPVTLNIVLPVGISFYTFQTLSYTIDIYRNKLKPSGTLVDYLAFVSFFPQLVAGPIERASSLLPQFAKKRSFDETLAATGCRLILWGMFKKLVVADNLAILVDSIYDGKTPANGILYIIATIFFAFQIYCDFSAYSSIARGTARLFSIELMENFNYPYFAKSLSEFWRRWHISLSTWFRDYVYIPLGGNRSWYPIAKLNLLVTFLLSGVWHGANWTFVIWGGLNGLALILIPKFLPSAPVPDGIFKRARETAACGMTFFVICCGWVFFRAESVQQAFAIFQQAGNDLFSSSAYAATLSIFDAEKNFRRGMIILLVFVMFEWTCRKYESPLEIPKLNSRPMRWAIYTSMIWGAVYWLPELAGQKFIYFEF